MLWPVLKTPKHTKILNPESTNYSKNFPEQLELPLNLQNSKIQIYSENKRKHTRTASRIIAE